MEAAAQQGSAALPHVNQNQPDRPAWTVEGLRKALRALQSGLPSTIHAGMRYLASIGMSREEAVDRAYGTASSTRTTIYTAQEAAELAASFACLWQDGIDGPDCRESVPFDPEAWCPMCVAREAVGK